MFKLWKLKRSRDKLQRVYDKALAELRAKKAPADDIHALESEEFHFMSEEYEAIDFFLSNKLLQEGAKYDVRIPSDDDPEFWVLRTDFSRGRLKPAGRNHVRRLIDEEKTRRFEVKTLWVTRIILPLAGVLVGIIGALTGLFAVTHQKKDEPEKRPSVYERLLDTATKK